MPRAPQCLPLITLQFLLLQKPKGFQLARGGKKKNKKHKIKMKSAYLKLGLTLKFQFVKLIESLADRLHSNHRPGEFVNGLLSKELGSRNPYRISTTPPLPLSATCLQQRKGVGDLLVFNLLFVGCKDWNQQQSGTNLSVLPTESRQCGIL